MRCQNCGKIEATIKIKQLSINGNIEYMYLCNICASQLQSTNGNETNKPIREFAAGFLSMLQRKQNEYNMDKSICDHCHLTFTDFLKHNRVGCEHCYKAFKEELTSIIKRVQNSHQRHIGKVPKAYELESKREEEISLLRKKLQKAIQVEAFEEAAKLRDRIREIERKGEDSGD